MANNPYVNKVVYGNNTIIDLTGDTATPSDVVSGKTFHDASGEAQQGSYVAPTITNITPSDANPVALTVGNNYGITTNGGYAIESEPTNVTPVNYDATALANGGVYKMGGAGYAISTYYDFTPSNTSPAPLARSRFHRTTAGSGYFSTVGYAVESYTSVTPSSTPTSVSSGDVVCVGGSGVIVDSVPTPTDITPSNSSPVALSQNGIYKAQSSGYAIQSYSSKTPSDSSPPSVSSGNIIKITGNGGYLYKTQQSGGGAFSEKYSSLTAGTSKSITGLTKSKHYLVLVYFVSATNMTYNRYDGCTASGGTLTKISNMGTSSLHAVGTFYDLNTTATSVTITAPYNAYCKVFGN